MLGRLYSKIGDFRNSLYEKDFLRSFSLGAPAISVGNITTGGTGKTPLVAHIAAVLAEKDELVCILTRGYGRADPRKRVLVSDLKAVLAGPRDAGDEPYELAQKLFGKAIVVADADRVSAAAWAKEVFGVSVFVLDDGFQHRRARRDLDIVCIDATDPFGGGRDMRRGLLREPPENLKRAGAIVITRADLVENIGQLKEQLNIYNPDCPVFTVSNRTSRLLEIGGANAETHGPSIRTHGEVVPKKALAFCAIGNPGNFFEQLRREGFNVVATRTFRDHHIYSKNDIRSLERAAADAGAEIMLSTPKDFFKLTQMQFGLPCIVVNSELVFDDDEGFRSLIYSFLSGGPLRSPQ